MALTVSVVVPSYRRPAMLQHCLRGLAQQTRPADEIVVVRRFDDDETAAMISTAPVPVLDVAVETPGLLAAMRAGVAQSAGEVIAFTDDDAIARPDWLAVLLDHYSLTGVGGVGGRDVTQPPRKEIERPSTGVGRVNEWGKLYGFHHVGVGEHSDVQVLKGVNMSFRRVALALPRQLRGAGAEVHNEIAISLWARAQGWRLIYDPGAVVDHSLGPRFDVDQRDRPAPQGVSNEAYNLVFTLLSLEPSLTRRRVAFGLLVGDRATPGLARAVVALAMGQPEVAHRLGPALGGQLAALRDLARGQRVEMVPASQLVA